MDSASNRHIAAAADFSQNNSTKEKSHHDTSNPDSPAQTRQMITKSSIDAHFAKIACEQLLVGNFIYEFGTTEFYAEAAVKQEIKRCTPNP
ncbi:MAG: hypothetical protein ASARMPREDX12_001898 [Alectoria sarmentosa]|nr:MAG: hypothetical protein ASARMPREDX12_001898 [Alectoria sarmentosa]CAD6587300.1 MAG: hypothetical protein ASARMPRED_003054 [Alectoria sarmentosa]